MPIRKPISIKEKPITSFDEITPEFLVEKEKTWEDVRLKELTLKNLQEVGEDYHDAKAYYDEVEQDCRWRAIRAISLGYDKKELSEAMGIPVRTITKWTKES
jgi:hypothetical protein